MSWTAPGLWAWSQILWVPRLVRQSHFRLCPPLIEISVFSNPMLLIYTYLIYVVLNKRLANKLLLFKEGHICSPSTLNLNPESAHAPLPPSPTSLSLTIRVLVQFDRIPSIISLSHKVVFKQKLQLHIKSSDVVLKN